jgi:hypothetical protein
VPTCERGCGNINSYRKAFVYQWWLEAGQTDIFA